MALFRGAGGAEFDIDVDKLRPQQRETHDAMVASGALVAVDAPKPKRPAKSTPPAQD